MIDGPSSRRRQMSALGQIDNMAGWRVGFMVGNRELVSALHASRVP